MTDDAHELSSHGRQTLQDFLRQASLRGERVVSFTRALLCVLMLLRLLVLYPDLIAAGDTKYMIGCSGFLAGLVVSLLALRLREDSPRLRGGLAMSVTADTLILVVVTLPTIVWPHERYSGLLREVDASAWLLIVVLAGARLDAWVALWGIGLNAVSLGVLIAVDHHLWGARLTYPPGDIMLIGVMFLGAAAFAWAGARGARVLVFQGANAYRLAERARQRLGVYVSESVATHALDQEELALGGQKSSAAILFSDLRGFTAYSERLDPEQLVGELNAYFEAMVAEIRAEGGLVDKFIGDAIMAVFGVPQGCEDPASRAIRAATAMQQALAEHNRARERDGLPPLRQGIGVHYGSVIAGHIGTTHRMQYTVVGDTVNVASRLESLTKEHGVPILISSDAVEAARAEPDADALPTMLHRGQIQVRGREAEMEVFGVQAWVEEPEPEAPAEEAGPSGAS